MQIKNLVFFLVLSAALVACKGGEKAAKGDKNKKEVEIMIQIRKAADISAICQAHRDVGLKQKRVLSARMATWLMTIMSSSDEMTEEILKKLKSDMDIINAQLNHKEVEIRDE